MSSRSAPRVSDGRLILRRWDPKAGLSESPLTFQTLDELFGLCLQIHEPDLVERIVINGFDQHGQPRVLTFTFQSVSISPKE